MGNIEIVLSMAERAVRQSIPPDPKAREALDAVRATLHGTVREVSGLRDVIADIDARLAKLSVGNIGSKTRSREVERWAAAHLNGVRTVAERALAEGPEA